MGRIIYRLIVLGCGQLELYTWSMDKLNEAFEGLIGKYEILRKDVLKQREGARRFLDKHFYFDLTFKEVEGKLFL
jgi:hypothetical protein